MNKVWSALNLDHNGDRYPSPPKLCVVFYTQIFYKFRDFNTFESLKKRSSITLSPPPTPLKLPSGNHHCLSIYSCRKIAIPTTSEPHYQSSGLVALKDYTIDTPRSNFNMHRLCHSCITCIRAIQFPLLLIVLLYS